MLILKYVVPSVAVSIAGAATAASNTAAALQQKFGCTACHSVEVQIVGPAFKAVAVKYRGREDAAAYLVRKIQSGGVGVWGSSPMPPQPSVSEADARALAAWVLGQ